jgi:hypothetical protein
MPCNNINKKPVPNSGIGFYVLSINTIYYLPVLFSPLYNINIKIYQTDYRGEDNIKKRKWAAGLTLLLLANGVGQVSAHEQAYTVRPGDSLEIVYSLWKIANTYHVAISDLKYWEWKMQ